MYGRKHIIAACNDACLKVLSILVSACFHSLDKVLRLSCCYRVKRGGFTISGVQYTGSVIVYSNLTLQWHCSDLDQLTPEALAPISLMRPKPEIVLLGTGTSPRPVPQAVRDALRKQGCSLDVAGTFSAASTFNLLQEEGRRVVGALLHLPEE